MKKILFFTSVFLCLILLSSCNSYDISKILFIASVGIEKKEDEYQGYFYLPLSSDIGKAENTENKGKGEFAKTSGKNIPELFYNLQNSTSFITNLKHVSSIVLNKELLNEEFIVDLLDYVKYSLDIDFNCYLFVTKAKMDELYDFQNPNQESVLNSLLVSTSDVDNSFLVSPPIHFLKFTREFYKDRSILIPMLDIEEIWTIEGEAVNNFHAQSAIYYYKGNLKEVVKNPSSPYFSTTTQFIDQIDKTSISFKNYKCNLEFKDVLHLKVEFSYELYRTQQGLQEEEIKAFVYNRIKSYLLDFQDIDPLNISYYNTLYDTNCSYDTINMEIKVLKN
ncbi:MAG: hypothetical protein NC310_06230 [Roseburia sp.]|nr:hypothetical protein [Anaeroplasma bactoclasticum]MCM1196647.1 hypothetical protein [Roseburia sp.]MCM1557531.1 hypothetical protein [Anaeroplasma bactoclasticum]